MNYADLHCDTPYELFIRGESFAHCSTDLSLARISRFEHYLQLAAFCAPPELDDTDAYKLAAEVYEYFRRDTAAACRICTDRDSLEDSLARRFPSFILTLEDARVTECKIERLDALYSLGVRVITPLWGGATCIGGSHESQLGLTDGGKRLVRHAARLGMILDISHASPRSADDILDIAESESAPVIASHSCAYSVYPASRNIHDRHAERTARLGGVIGVNLYPPHLAGSVASLSDAARHIKYLTDLIGSDAVCLGCDFDGMGVYTVGGESPECLPALRDELARVGISDAVCEKILFTNAYDFLKRSL